MDSSKSLFTTNAAAWLNYSWRDYKQPTSLDTPEYIVQHVHTHDPYGPFGAKEVGEGPIVVTMSAVARAVANALGGMVHEIPVTPWRVLRRLRAQGRARRSQQPS